MGAVDKSPGRGRSYDSDRRAIQAEIRRIDRERNDGRPGSVISSDEARLVIPGPLDDTGRGGAVLTWDEDLHQPRWQSGGGVTGVTRLTAHSLVQTNAAAPVGSSVTFSGYTVAALWGDELDVTQSATAGRIGFGTAGAYQACAYVRLAWDSGDTVDEVRASADWDGADPYPLWYRRLGSNDGLGGDPSLRDSFSWGPFYVDAGGWTFFGLNWMTNENCFLSAMALDIWKVG